MATRFSIRHPFDCDAATFWSIFFDPAFNQEQYRRMQCEWKPLRQEETAETILREQEVTPRKGASGVLGKVLGSASPRYVERGTFRKPSGPFEVTVSVPALGDRFALSAQLSVTALGETRCERAFAGECTVRIPLIGRQAEGLLITQLEESYEIATALHREWIVRRSQGSASES